MTYQGIDSIKDTWKTSFRSIGNQETGCQLGFGFMHKDGVEVDEMKSHFPFYSAIYVIRGRGTYIDHRGTKSELKPGTVFQRIPGREHSTILDPRSRWAECFIDFGTSIYQNFLEKMNIVDPDTPVITTGVDRSIEEYIHSMMSEIEVCEEQQLPDLLLKSLEFLRILLKRGYVRKRERQSKSLIEESCRDFTRDYSQRVDLTEYCSSRGIGYESFRKQFKRMTGLPPGRYIIRRRVDMACHILLTTDDPIFQIAEELGYKSPYEFSSQFKDLTGISPRDYRFKKTFTKT